MLSSIPTRRELLAWALAIIMTVTAVMLARPERAGAGASGPTTEVVYIATGQNFPDALGAAATAAVGLGPVLLVEQNSIPAPTLTELNRLQPSNIVIVGGTAVISNGVEASLEALAFSPTVTRIAGSNRYDTAAQLSAATFPTNGRYPLAVHADGDQAMLLTSAPSVVRSVSLTAPVSGTVIVNSTASAIEDTAGHGVRCSITTGTSINYSYLQISISSGDNGRYAQLSGTRGFDVAAGQTLSVNLVCERFSAVGTSNISDSALTAIFVADT